MVEPSIHAATYLWYCFCLDTQGLLYIELLECHRWQLKRR